MITGRDLKQAGIPKEFHARLRRWFRGFHYKIERHHITLHGGPFDEQEVWIEEEKGGLLPMRGGRYVEGYDKDRGAMVWESAEDRP